MEPRSLAFVVEACGGRLLRGDPGRVVMGCGTDSRTARAGEVFVALRGARFDGHQFVPELVDRGVAAVVVEKPDGVPSAADCGVILVADARQAYGRLAATYRRGYELPLVAVGGSNGKTTTKDLVAGVLAEAFPVVKSAASFNNDVGVPATLLQIGARHRAAVVEVGSNHPGELAPLVRMASPQFGVLTSLGREHLEHFGDLAGVVEEEGWLGELLPTEGTLWVNGDSPGIETVCGRSRAQVVRAGWGAANDWRASNIRLDWQGTTFEVHGPVASLCGAHQLRLLGRHHAVNALFAMAVGAQLGLDAETIRRGLARCEASPRRMERFEAEGLRVLDDSYNANPDSMAGALETLRLLPVEGRRIAVLGEMAELGGADEGALVEVGRWAGETADVVLGVGRRMAGFAEAARAAGRACVEQADDAAAALAWLKQSVRPGDAVLVKASRLAGLDRVADGLRPGGVSPGRVSGV